ncbi:hypothetical protein [Brevibacillus parabrevis]
MGDGTTINRIVPVQTNGQ